MTHDVAIGDVAVDATCATAESPTRTVPPPPTPERSGRPDPCGSVNQPTWLSRLGRVAAGLAAAPDLATIVDIVLSHVAEAVRARVTTLYRLDDDGVMTMLGHRGGTPQSMARWASFPVTLDTPLTDAMRSRRLIVVSGRPEVERRYPALAGQVGETSTLVALPLAVGARSVGVVGLSFSAAWSVGRHELDFLAAFADTCAQAMDRIRARAEARDASAKLSFLVTASAQLNSSLDYRTTLANVARLAVPSLAEWCAVDIVEDGQLRTLALAHADPAKVALAEEMHRRYPSDSAAPTGAAAVIRTGVSELYPRITDETLAAGARDGEHLRLMHELDLRSALRVPLRARGRVFGVLTMVSGADRPPFAAADVSFAEEIALRASLAVDNAQLYSETREVAVRLQRAVLPERLDDIADWEVATYYCPAGRTEVGGDFYDALRLPDGRLVVVIGDVMGRGVFAAAAMAQVRAAIRAYLALDPAPGGVLRRLDSMFGMYEISGLVTLGYLLLDPHRRRLDMVNAGHCPPVLVTCDGAAELVHAAVSLPLGTGGDERVVTSRDWPPSATLLVYTDGLVERRNEDIDAGLARITAHAGALAGPCLRDGLTEVVAAVRDQTRDDDVTALAVRWRP